MALPQLPKLSNVPTWNVKRRYRVGSLVKVGNNIYQNKTGLNGDPILLVDWWVLNRQFDATVLTDDVGAMAGSIAVKAYALAFANSLSTTNVTAVPFTNATLESAYPAAPLRFEVYCPNVGSGMLYRKVDTAQWIAVPVTVL